MSSAFKYRQQFYQDYFNSQSGRTFSLDLETKIKSEEFRYDKCTTYSVPILLDADGKTEYKLLLRFPNKTNFVFSSMLPMTILTLLFVVIIIVLISLVTELFIYIYKKIINVSFF